MDKLNIETTPTYIWDDRYNSNRWRGDFVSLAEIEKYKKKMVISPFSCDNPDPITGKSCGNEFDIYETKSSINCITSDGTASTLCNITYRYYPQGTSCIILEEEPTTNTFRPFTRKVRDLCSKCTSSNEGIYGKHKRETFVCFDRNYVV